MSKLFVATGNAGKLKELTEAIAELYPKKFASVVGRAAQSVEESESTFEGNAKIKSHALMRELCADGFLDFYVLADDSGLEVDELGGAPGVHSARYAGDHVAPAEHMKKLISELKLAGVADRAATARFVCALSMIRVMGGKLDREVSSRGTCEGTICFHPSGHHGFGYDPIFWIPYRDCTMAELGAEEKNSLAPRRRFSFAQTPLATPANFWIIQFGYFSELSYRRCGVLK